MRIIRNSARCHGCGDVVESTRRHHYQPCGCGNIAVDGGRDYLRRVVADETVGYTDTSLTEPSEEPPDVP